MKIFIQIPCFNEELQLENAINEIKKSVDPNKYNYEIIIIDDGSTDKTVDIAKKNNVKNIISLKRNMGLGYAFNEGRKFAFEKNVDVLVNTDADKLTFVCHPIVSTIHGNCHTQRCICKLINSWPKNKNTIFCWTMIIQI